MADSKYPVHFVTYCVLLKLYREMKECLGVCAFVEYKYMCVCKKWWESEHNTNHIINC